MPGLLDIAKSVQTVPVNGTPVSVYGVSASGIVVLLQRFPVFREFFTGRAPDLTAEAIMTLVPESIAVIIAAGCGNPGEEEAEKVAANLGAEAQADLLTAILKLTMPGGAGPFVEKLMALVNTLDVESMSTPVTKSPAPSSPSPASE